MAVTVTGDGELRWKGRDRTESHRALRAEEGGDDDDDDATLSRTWDPTTAAGGDRDTLLCMASAASTDHTCSALLFCYS